MKNKGLAIFNLRSAAFAAALTIILSGFISAQLSSGGDFVLQQQVIAGGGGDSSDSTDMIFRLRGTIGQSAAGTRMTGGAFTQIGGFWNPSLAPTAAMVSISGRVVDQNGAGISNAFLTLNGVLQTTSRSVATNNFGRFRFDDLQVGSMYVLSVRAKGFSFEEDTYSFVLDDELNSIVFQAAEILQ